MPPALRGQSDAAGPGKERTSAIRATRCRVVWFQRRIASTLAIWLSRESRLHGTVRPTRHFAINSLRTNRRMSVAPALYIQGRFRVGMIKGKNNMEVQDRDGKSHAGAQSIVPIVGYPPEAVHPAPKRRHLPSTKR